MHFGKRQSSRIASLPFSREAMRRYIYNRSLIRERLDRLKNKKVLIQRLKLMFKALKIFLVTK